MPNPTVGKIAAILPSHSTQGEWITTPAWYCEEDINLRNGKGAEEIAGYLETAFTEGFNYKAIKSLDGYIHNQKGTIFQFWMHNDPNAEMYFYQIWEEDAHLDELSSQYQPDEDAIFKSEDIFADLGLKTP